MSLKPGGSGATQIDNSVASEFDSTVFSQLIEAGDCLSEIDEWDDAGEGKL
jgi:hypothetical protein